jgi:hypothetical protein
MMATLLADPHLEYRCIFFREDGTQEIRYASEPPRQIDLSACGGVPKGIGPVAAGQLYPRVVGEYCDGPLSDFAHQADLAHVAPVCERLGDDHEFAPA